MPTLYELTNEMLALDEAFHAANGELNPELEELLENLDLAHRDKVDAYCALISETLARHAGRKNEANRLATLAKADLAFADRLKRRLHDHMRVTDQKRIDTDRYRVSRCANGGAPTVIVDSTPERLPSWAQRVEIQADLDQIKNRLNAGETLPFARFAERGEHLRIA